MDDIKLSNGSVAGFFESGLQLPVYQEISKLI